MPILTLTGAVMVVVVCLGLAAAGGAALGGSGWAATPPGEAEEPRALVPNTAVVGVPKDDAWWRGRHEAFNARAAEAARDGGVRMVFIGDSITQGWGEAGKGVWERFYEKRGAVNFGISGDRTQHVIWRIENGNLKGLGEDGMGAPAAGKGVELVVVLIGTNNAPATAGNTGEEIGAGIVAVVGKVREKLPRARVLVLGVLPRGGEGEEARVMREKNKRASEIAKGAADGEWVRFLDLGGLFLGEDGGVSRELMPDLLHLSERGYEVWAKGMEGVVKEVLGEGKE